MTTETAYRALQDELAAIETTHNLYLVDESVDAENIPTGLEGDRYWAAMIYAAEAAAGQRAEAAGLDINALIGRTIY